MAGASAGRGSGAFGFLQAYAKEEFGDKAAPAIANMYKEYFAAPAHFGDPPREYGDQLYHTEARQLMQTYMIDSPFYAIPSQSPKWTVPRVLGMQFGFRPGGKAVDADDGKAGT